MIDGWEKLLYGSTKTIGALSLLMEWMIIQAGAKELDTLGGQTKSQVVSTISDNFANAGEYRALKEFG